VIRKHRALASWRHVVPVLFVSSILVALASIALTATFGMSATAWVISSALAIELMAYLLACVAATVPFFASLPFSALVVLPIVIATYHVAYGLGFLIGLLRPAGQRPEGDTAPAQLFTTLTR
jgi:hypothetical protein